MNKEVNPLARVSCLRQTQNQSPMRCFAHFSEPTGRHVENWSNRFSFQFIDE